MIGVPSAWMMELLFASLTKRWLEGKISVADRLKYLEYLANAGQHYGAAVVAAIAPADNTSLAIVAEALWKVTQWGVERRWRRLRGQGAPVGSGTT